MKVLVIGQGGREHAIIKSISQSPLVAEIHAIPGSAGMAKEALCHDISSKDHEQILRLCLRKEIDYVFIGPEEPLVDGLADSLRERGILVVGPGSEGARLEGSKIFAKEFMQEAGVPTSAYQIVDSVESTLNASDAFTPPYVLKADGLAAGKGVYICKDKEELKQAAVKLFVDKSLGSAGERALLEQYMPGWELSFLVLTNGQDFSPLPLAQDHKRLKEGQTGPNTGGMGTIAPLPISADLHQEIIEKIVRPSIALLHQKKIIYRGILFIGVMVTPQGPQVLEYNVRLGDPETQVILPLIENDTATLFKKISEGQLETLRTKSIYSCCVVMAAEGYPDAPQKGVAITGDLHAETPSSYFIHAGSKRSANNVWQTNGGRVLGAVGLGSNAEEAIANAYQQARCAQWPGMQMRTDIGKYLKENI